MKQMYKAISLTISLCFLVNTTAYNMPMNSTINQSVIDELAAGSICNKMLGPVPYEKGTLKLALMASLNDIAGKDQKIDPKEVRKHAEKYRNNVFDKRHFFFAEHGELPDDRIWVKCRIEQQYAREHLQHIPSVDSYLEMEKKLLSTYYAVFSTAKKNNGFDVKMYTEKEWNNKWKQIYETGKSPEKYVSREEKIEEMGVDQYVYEHKLNIDKFIEKHIGEGNFAEIEGRAESEELNWDNKYPDRIKPEKFFSGKLWDFLQFNMNPFLKYFGGSIDKAFRKKNIVFIRVLNAEDLPVIRRNGQELPVTSHASENAVYVFLRENIFDTLLGKSKLFDEMAESQKTVDPLQTQNKWESLEIFCPLMNKCVIPRLMHEVGASYDFKWEVKGLSIVNALDVAWQKFQKELKEFVQKGGSAVNFDFTKFAEEFRKEIEDFKKFEGEPVKLDENILDRDYSGTEEEAVLGEIKEKFKNPKMIKMFLKLSRAFTIDELEWLIELFHDKTLEMEMFGDKGLIDPYENLRPACAEAFNKLAWMIDRAIKLNPDLDFPKFDEKIILNQKGDNLALIGGVETLLMALEIQKGAGFFDPVAKKLLIFKPLRDEELKPVALLEKDIRNILEKDMVKHAKTIFKNLNTVSILRGYLGENSIIRSKKIRRDSFMFKGQAYDNEFYLKKAEEIKEGFFIIPCSTFYAGENHYYNVLVDARGENLEINVMNQEETEVIKTCLSNDFAESFERDPADREIMDNYLEHEEKIDKVIRDAIRRGDYSSLTAEEFEPLFNVRLKLHTILEQMLFGSDLNKAFQLHVMGKIMEQLKDITIINVGKKTNLPKITVKRPIKQDTDKRIEQEVTVRAHTGARGRYIFLTGREYAKLGQLDLNATNKELKSNIEKWIMHEFGIPLGLSDVTWDKEKGSLCNNFDDLYAEYENRIEFDSYDDLILSKQGQAKNKEITDFKVVAEELKKILMSREKNPIVDINNLRGINAAGLTYERDYAMAVFDNKLVKMLIAKFKWPEILKLKFLKISSAKYKTNFLEICRCFTEKTLERLVDIYDPEIFFFTERNIERDKECMRTLEAELRNRTKITNIRYDKFDRIKIDMIGGVQTLRDALLLKLHFGRWSIKSGTAELMSLPDEKLKAVALLQKDIWDIVSKHGDDLKNKIMKIERDPSSSYGRQYDSIFDFKKMKRNILGKDTILIPCHSLKENGIDYEKYYIMVSSLSKTKFRLSRNFKVLTKHEKEILEELYKSRIELDFQRPDEDKEDIFYYLQHERNIDNVIDDAIRNGRYTVISRSESTLLGDIYTTVRKIFDLFVPTKNREDLINKIMCRQYMLINVGDVKKLPQVELKIGSKKHQVIVRMHPGPRGKYIFLTNEEYSAYHTLKDKINSVQQKRTNSIITRSVVHDMGVPLGLTVWGVEDSEDGLFVLNDLDLAYKVWPKIEKDDERLDKTQFPELSVILKKENPLVDLNILSGTNAAGKRYKRDFIAGTVKERDPAIKEIWDKVDGTDNVKYLEALLAVLEKDKIAEIDMDQQVLLAGGGYFNFQVLKNRLENAGIKPVLENKIKFLKTKQKYQQEDICNNKMIKRWSEIKKSNALEKFKVYLKILENGNDAEYSHDEDILISPSRLPFDRKKIQAHLKDINAGPILRYKIKFLEMQQHLTKFKYQSGYIDLIPKVNRVLSAIDEDVESLVLNKIYDVLTNWEEGENLKEKQIYFNCRFKFNNLEDVERVFSFLFRQEAADLVKARLDLLAASSEEEIKCKECGETLEALNALENINDIGWIDTVMEMLEEHGEIKIDKNKKVNATEDGIENGIKPFLRYKSVYLKKTAKWKLEHEALLLDEIESMNDINKLEALLRIVTSQELESEDITLIRENFDTDDLLFMFDLPCVKDAIKERIENLNGGFQKKQFAKKEAAAIYVGEQIAPPESNYTLFVLNDFVTDGEYGEDQEDYGSRFGLERIGTTKPHEIVKDILGRIKELKESKKDFSSKNVIVQLPKEFAEKSEKYISHVEKLKEEAPGIQFIVVDTGQGAVKYAEGRKEYRRKIYTIMRLIKKLDEDISPELRADVDMFLRRFLKDCLLNVDGTTDSLYENYIDALAKNKIVDILKTILLYKPAEALPDPDLDKTVYMLTFA